MSSRWGQTFKKGDPVRWRLARGGLGGPGVYLRLAKADDFSRAYGKQAVIDVGDGQTMEVGLDDLVPDKAGGAARKFPKGGPCGQFKTAPARKKCRARVSAKIGKLVGEGMSQQQAIAATLSMESAGRIGPRGGYHRAGRGRRAEQWTVWMWSYRRATWDSMFTASTRDEAASWARRNSGWNAPVRIQTGRTPPDGGPLS